MAHESKTFEAGQPIAIVGMACRFPGADNLSAFWRQLEAGECAVIEGVPGSGVGRIGELFPDSSVQARACRFGAYLDRLDQFDAAFFRISPVEAQLLDPQQRLMLETSWRALEDAGVDPDRLKGSRTGVYAGISNNEYRNLILDISDTSEPAVSLYSVTGTSFNTAIGRVAYVLGLEGPAMAVDTACSSSLVATHQAVTGLQRGEADLALAGGVHTILSGKLLEFRANAGMLSPDGRCKTFDAAANGYVRGEGCGIIVLKRLSEAEADGDRIWGVIRGSALNQDGASPGLTVPSGAAQQGVIEAALHRAGVSASQVDYVEAHGTGTEVGDPIEAKAMGTAYGKEREADHPLLVGSVKTNVGHLEAAAGVAGLIKVLLAMNHKIIPKHLHFQNPSPQIDWERLPLRVTSEPTDWPPHPDRPPLAGVSGFGWSGTNAHVVLEGYEAPDEAASSMGERYWVAGSPKPVTEPPAEEPTAGRGTHLLPLSGKSGPALRELAGRYRDWLDECGDLSPADAGDPLLSDMAWTAGVGRSHFPHRAGVVFNDAESLRVGLTELAEASDEPEPRETGKVAFVYTGQASQWVGMGEELYESEPVVRAVLDRCDALLREERGESLLDVMFGRSGELDDPAWVQPAIYALECALTALWASVGVRPDVVLGHSLGEIAAAQAAGVLSLEDGLRFAATRGALMGALPGEGAMAAVFAPGSKVAEALDEHNAASEGVGLCIAADNGAHQVISGPKAEVEAILQRFESEEIQAKQLRKSPAYHSPMVEPALEGLDPLLESMKFASPSLPLVSNVTGQEAGPGTALDKAYWRRQMREPVAFRRAVETLAELGTEIVVEIGPHAVLGPMTLMAWPESAGGSPTTLSSLVRPSRDAPASEVRGAFVRAVSGAYEAGLPIRFEGLFSGETRRRIALPGYPFQYESYWVQASRRRRQDAGHPLLGSRHESARGGTTFETEIYPSDPAWLSDHRVFGRLVAPGALYGVMAASASVAEGAGSAAVEDMQLHNPLVFAKESSEDGADDGRKMQVLLDDVEKTLSRRFQVFSQGDDGEWTLHAEGRIPSSPGSGGPEASPQVDLEGLKADLAPEDMFAFYRARAEAGIDLGPSFRTLEKAWSRAGEALGEVVFPETCGRDGLEVHPLLLDGCFQVVAIARNAAEAGGTYLPFGWERLWLAGRLPDRLVCHVRMREDSRPSDSETDAPPEVLTGDMRIYDPGGALIGELNGYTVKRATRAALLAAVEGVEDFLYETVWRDCALAPGMPPADFFPSPTAIAAESDPFTRYLADEGVGAEDRTALLEDLERLSRFYALWTLEKLGWERTAGTAVDSEELRERLGVLEVHKRLFRRMLEMLAKSGVLEAAGDGFSVAVGSGDPLPEEISGDPQEFAIQMAARYSHGSNEIGLFRRCGGALSEVLLGREDSLSLLFSSGEPTAADLYMKAPVARAANRMLGDAVATLMKEVPDGRRLRVLEIGAGTGSATASVLPELPEGRFDYVYTDISAGFFSEAEARFQGGGAPIDYRVLDIEKDPIEQGFDPHGYDLLIASNVLHATRYLEETLAHCRELLAPSGQLVALENLRGQGWLDLTFGQLDGWWRFADSYRPHHALASPEVWRQAFSDAEFSDVEVLGVNRSDPAERPDRGVIVAQGPAEVVELAGAWILVADHGGVAEDLATDLAARNQTVVLVGEDAQADAEPAEDGPKIIRTSLEIERRESWQSLAEGLPEDVPLNGAVHCVALDGHGIHATTEEMAEDTRRIGASALALVQGLTDADAMPAKGLWLVTRGAQVLEKERTGELAGATLWGFGKVVAREAAQLQPRMIDLDPGESAPLADLANELLYPDAETQVAYRVGRRQVARLIRFGSGTERLTVPEDSGWMLEPDSGGALEELRVESLPARTLEPKEVRVAVEAAGLNFWDMFRAIGMIDTGLLGGEVCGRVLEVGSDVSTVSVGDCVTALAFGTFGSEAVMREEMVAPVPPGIPITALATMPTAFVSALLSFDLAELKAGDRVLIHAGAGGVGLAAIQLAQAAGAEVFATASAPKQAYLRSLGVEHVFDSRQTAFGREILEATDGAGVDVVLNSLTGEGFIEASLSCMAQGGRFVELARVGILSPDEMKEARPDAAYFILMLDVLKEDDPVQPGDALRRVMARLAEGELTPLTHSRWSLAETGPAIKFMRAARHIGKIVLTTSPLERGQLRQDRTYLVTGGLGGIGCAVAGWLADRGAGAIVLNGRRDPDPEVEEAIASLRDRGFTVQVELADVTDAKAVDEMLARMDQDLPPLGGIIHSVGVLSDSALGNQTWENFEKVLWPKMLGAWHLHRATVDRDLDLFILFSSVAGIMGNPGQANHAAANVFLDQLAAHRRALGLPGQAIAWGAWSGLGEAEEQRERIAQRLAAFGTSWITPQQGLKAFDQLVRQDSATSVVLAVDWAMFGEAIGSRPPLLEDLLSDALEGDDEAVTSSDDLLTRLRQTPAAGRMDLMVSFLQQEVQAVQRLPSAPAPTVGFFDLGMDSLMAVELRNRLNQSLSGEYTAPNTLVFDYPSIADLAGHLVEELGDAEGAATPEAQPEPSRQPAPRREDDRIAVVGMACRLPGAPDLSAFWRQLEAGDSAVTDGRPGSGHWGGAVGDPAADEIFFRRGGFVEGIDQFDAGFFGIRPIEARTMDPRQRLLLETSWQAFEDAGIDPGLWKGNRAGIYVGVGGSEYRDLVSAGGEVGNYFGTTGSVAVGRIAFVLGFMGPAVPLDMTCASSLVSVHQAVAGLQRGEVDLALAGGVHAALSPAVTKFMAEFGMLSRSGQCRTFDSAADGFVRGEGCGMVILKRLSEAEADGDRIWGVVASSAVNQNGASAGLTVPSGSAQEQVMKEALSQAGISPSEVDYLETHGTGSELGDPIEVRASAAAYGEGRDMDHPLLIGSVKPNIGHLEWAAGVASLIKVLLAMQRRVIPGQLNFQSPNSHINWDQLPIRVISEATDWPDASGHPPRAGISAFGLSGTNAHVVVEGYETLDGADFDAGEQYRAAGRSKPVAVSVPESIVEPPAEEPTAGRGTRLLPLSGKSGPALRELAGRYRDWLDECGDLSPTDAGDSLLSDMAWTAGVGRSHFPHRAGVVFNDAESLRAGLTELAEASDEPEPRETGKVAFVYTGQASQWVGMGEELYESEPVVRAVLDRCDALLREERGESLLDVMFGRSGELDDPAWVQPAIYALECALTALWTSVGVRPDVVLGHSLGEIAAAQAAGVLNLEDGLRFAATRGALMGALPEGGEENGQALGELEALFADVTISPPSLTLVSSLRGGAVGLDDVLDGAYWRRQALEPAAFQGCVETLAELGVDVILEIGPQAESDPMATMIQQDLVDESAEQAPVVLPNLLADAQASGSEADRFVETVAGAYRAGLPISFAGLFSGEVRRRIPLPGYPFQRQRYWVETPK